MYITYNFDGYEYEFEIPSYAIDEIVEKHYPEWSDDPWYFLQFEENEELFRDEWEDYLHRMFEDQAFEEAKEQAMDPYAFYGVSRSQF